MILYKIFSALFEMLASFYSRGTLELEKGTWKIIS